MKTISQVAKRLGPGSVIRVAGAWSAVVAVSAAALLVSGVGAWADSGAEKSVLIFPALMPKSGPIVAPPENDIRLAYKNRFEPFWTENSYGRFQTNTTVLGYGNLPWSKAPRALLPIGADLPDKLTEGYTPEKYPYNPLHPITGDLYGDSHPVLDGFYTPGERFRDNDGNGRYTLAEPFTDVDSQTPRLGADPGSLLDCWDPHGERFVDLTGVQGTGRLGFYDLSVLVEIYDAGLDARGELFTDLNGNGVWDGAGTRIYNLLIDTRVYSGTDAWGTPDGSIGRTTLYYADVNGNGKWDPGEDVWEEVSESFTDLNGNGKWDAGTVGKYDDKIDQRVWTDGPATAWGAVDPTAVGTNVYIRFTDTNLNGKFDEGEPWSVVWQDRAESWTDVPGGGRIAGVCDILTPAQTNGVYNYLIDTQVFSGSAWVTPQLAVGSQAGLYYWDADLNGKYTAGEVIWYGTATYNSVTSKRVVPIATDMQWLSIASGTIGSQTGLFYVDYNGVPFFDLNLVNIWKDRRSEPVVGDLNNNDEYDASSIGKYDVIDLIIAGVAPALGTVGTPAYMLVQGGQTFVWVDAAEPWVDLLPNGRYDPPNVGIYDNGIDRKVWDGGDGVWDAKQGDAGINTGIFYFDANNNQIYDPTEDIWQDVGGEPFVDANRDGLYTPGIAGDGIDGQTNGPANRAVPVNELEPGGGGALPPVVLPAGAGGLAVFIGDYRTRAHDYNGHPVQPWQPPNGVFDDGWAAINRPAQYKQVQTVTGPLMVRYFIAGPVVTDPVTGLNSRPRIAVDAPVYETIEPFVDVNLDGVWQNREPFEDFLLQWDGDKKWVPVTNQYIYDNYPPAGGDFGPTATYPHAIAGNGVPSNVDEIIWRSGDGSTLINLTSDISDDNYLIASQAFSDRRGKLWGHPDLMVDLLVPGFLDPAFTVPTLIRGNPNDIYDSPDGFEDHGNTKMQQALVMLNLFTMLDAWDPHGFYGGDPNQWWSATFGTQSPGFPSTIPVVAGFDAATQRGMNVKLPNFRFLLGGIQVGAGSDYPDTSQQWFDSWREFRDLPSSIYHHGGDYRLGEETDPRTDSIFGADHGVNNPLAQVQGDGVIRGAGPLAYNEHGDFGYDAGNQLTIELLTWRTDGHSNTDSPTNATFYPAPGGWVGTDSAKRRCRDVNLDGLIDQGACPGHGFSNYTADWNIPGTPDDGSHTAYPFNRVRFIEDCMALADGIVDFELFSDTGNWIDYCVGLYPDGYPGPDFQGLSGMSGLVVTLDRPDPIFFGGQVTNMSGTEVPPLPGQPVQSDFGMRLVAHEATHDWFGVLDLYDNDRLNGIINNFPIGAFDLMADGGLVHYTGPYKSFFGWTAPVDLKRVLRSGQIENLDLYPIETQPNQYYVFQRDTGPEQFWFWYEDGLGQFSKGFGNGLIIEHVDFGVNADAFPEQQRHNDHYTYEIIPADGLFQMQDGINPGDAGDLWPGTSGNTTWTADTNPSSRWWDLVESGIEILNIVLPANPLDPLRVTFRWIDRPVPSLSFFNPPGGTTVGSLYNLTYDAWDFWGGTRIYLYRDNDNSGNDGVLIGGPITKLPGDTRDLFQTAINALPNGNYYFYALLVPGTALDEDNNPQTEPAYSPPIPALTNVGDGTLTVGSVTINPAGPMTANSSLQIWTVICTAAAVGPTPAKFSVRGSVTGLEAALATADTPFTPVRPFTGITFTVHTGGTPFAVGDGFTFRTTGLTPYSAPLYIVGGTTPGSNKYPGDQPKFADNDSDRLPDWWEYLIFGNLTTASGVAGAETNHDADRLNDLYEYWAGTNPYFWDSNSDGISDDYDDPDGDGLTNYEEQLLNTRPDLWDTDDDGLGDGVELAAGSDPLNGFIPLQARSILLDGLTTSYVTMPIQQRFALAASFTIEAKVKPAAGFNQAATVIQRVVGMYYGKPMVNYGIRLSATGLPEAFYTNGLGTEHKVAASASIPLGSWTSLAMTYDATAKRLSLYINGMLANGVNTYLLPVTVSNAQPFTRAGENLKGSVDELRFWNIALPGATILNNLNLTLLGNEAGLVAYYRFDDGGVTAQDAMLTSAQDWNNDWGNAATLDGNAKFDPPAIQDSDGDGLPDWWEILYFGDLSQDGTGNPDCDPLNNLQEYLAGTDPTNADSNGDGVLDGWQWLPTVPQPWIGITPSVGGLVARDALLQANTNIVPAIDPMLGVPLTYSYKWTKNADPTVLSTTNTLNLAPLGLGAGVAINLEVTAHAPNSCNVLNPFASPVATVTVTTSTSTALVRPVPLSFLPLAPTPANTLVVAVRNPNPVTVTLALTWYRNHAFVKTTAIVTAGSATSSFTYPGTGDAPLVAGDIWYFTVYAYDGSGGISAGYNSLTEPGGLGSRLVVGSGSGSGGGGAGGGLGGAAADAGISGQLTAKVTPALPFIDDILLCSASGASTAAGIPFGYFFSWYVFDQTTATYVPLNQAGPTLDLATVGNPQTIINGTTVGGVSTGGTWLTLVNRPDEFIVTGATINNPVVNQQTGAITGGTIILGTNRGAGLAGSTTIGGVTVGVNANGNPITIYGGTTIGGDTLNGIIAGGTVTDGIITPIPPVGVTTVIGVTLSRGPDLNGTNHEVVLAGVTLTGGNTAGGTTKGSATPGLTVGGRIYCQVYAMDAYGKRSATVASNVVTIQANPSSITSPDGLGKYEPNDTAAQARRITPKLNPTSIADPNIQAQATINGDQDWYWFLVPDTWGNRSSRVMFETNNGTTMYTSSHSSLTDLDDTQLKLYDKGLNQLLFVDDIGNAGALGSTKYARFDTMLKPGLYYVMVTTVLPQAFAYSAHLVVEPGAGALPPTSPTSVILAPALPSDGDDLVCTATGATSGLGAGAIVYRYTWFRDGQVMPFQTSAPLNFAAFGFEFAQSTTSNTLNNAFTQPGEAWTCLVFATDPNGISAPVASNTVVIAGVAAPPPSAGWAMVISSRTTVLGNPVPVDSSATVGWLSGATNGFDPNIDQQLLVAPPVPGSGTALPAGTLYAIGLQAAYPALSVDIRPPGMAISWYLKLDLGTVGQAATLSWDNLDVPSSAVPLTLTEIDPVTFLPVPGTTVDMSTTNQLVVPNVTGASSKIYRVAFGGGDGMQTLHLNFGWNLISFAVQPTGVQADMEQAFFVNGTSVKLGPVWALQNGGYIAATTIQAETGYWVYSPLTAGATVTVYGTPPAPGNIALGIGWNLVGFLANTPRPLAPFIDAVYGYTGTGYSTPTTVMTGSGYWIHTTAAGSIPAQ